MKLYNYKVLRQTMAKNSSRQQSQVTKSGNSLWENNTGSSRRQLHWERRKSPSIVQMIDGLKGPHLQTALLRLISAVHPGKHWSMEQLTLKYLT